MVFGKAVRISDICLLVDNIERTIEFYEAKLGFELRRRAEGFADFKGNGIILAAWEINHLHAHTGVSNQRAGENVHKACVAVELTCPEDVDRYYVELSSKGVPFHGPPDNYVWNARCAYFADPDGTLWEIYAWLSGGPEEYHQVS